MPEHNQGMYAVPQILTNNVEDFLCTAKKLGDYGYKEVNLNLGCPSRTVVTKGRGAGFLDEPQKLDRFLIRFLRNVIWRFQSRRESEWKIRRNSRQSFLSIINIR